MEKPIANAIKALPDDNALKVALVEAFAPVPATEPVHEAPVAELTVVPDARGAEAVLNLCELRDKWHQVAISGASYAEYCHEFVGELDALIAAATRG